MSGVKNLIEEKSTKGKKLVSNADLKAAASNKDKKKKK